MLLKINLSTFFANNQQQCKFLKNFLNNLEKLLAL